MRLTIVAWLATAAIASGQAVRYLDNAHAKNDIHMDGHKLLDLDLSNLDVASDWGDIGGSISAQTDLQAALNAKEGTIAAGTSGQYFRGDKTFQTLNQAAIAGLTTADSPIFAGLNIGGMNPAIGYNLGVFTFGSATPGFSAAWEFRSGTKGGWRITPRSSPNSILLEAIGTNQGIEFAPNGSGATTFDGDVSITGTLNGYVPTARTVAGKALTANITLATGDLTDAANVQLKNGALAIAGFGSITGTLPIANIPTGTTGSTVALGNHTHAFSAITSPPTTLTGYGITDAQSLTGTLAIAGFGSITGTLPIANIPTGTSGTTVALGNHGHAEADVTNLVSDLAAKVPTTRTVNGHALSSDVTVTASDIGAVTSVPANLTLYVDAVNGNNGSAVKGRVDKPWQTLDTALAAASSGDMIFVHPGTYTPTNQLLKDGVNWRFAPGAVVTQTGGNYALFDDSSGGANGPVTCTIIAYGASFTKTGGILPRGAVVTVTNASSNVSIWAGSLNRSSGTPSTVYNSGGTLHVQADEIHQTGNGPPIWWDGNGEMFVKADLLHSTTSYTVYCSGSPTTKKMWVEADLIQCDGGATSVIHNIVSDPSSTIWIIAKEIRYGGTSDAVKLVNSTNGKLYLTAQKVGAETNGTGIVVSGGLFWCNVQKVSVPRNFLTVTGGTAFVDVLNMDTNGANTNGGISISGGTAYVRGLYLNSAEDGVNVSAGTLNLTGYKITSGSSNFDLNQSSTGVLNVAGVNYSASKTTGTINNLNVSDAALTSAWDGVATTAPSKNALYDYLHIADADDDGKVDVLDQGAGIAITNGSGVLQTPLTDNHTNWDTAFTDRNKWDGGATGLNASTGRTSLGLGTSATIDTGTSGTKIPLLNAANTWTAGQKQTFGADGTNAGLKFAGVTADPSSLAGGDVWFRSDTPALKYYDGTTTKSLLTGNQTITLSGDLSGSGTTAIAATIGNNIVTNAKAAQMAAATIKGNKTSSTANQADLSVAEVQGLIEAPVVLKAKNLTVLTSGTPADIGTFTLPAGITRYRLLGNSSSAAGGFIIAETASGTLAGASFTVRDAATGGGTAISTAAAGPTSTTTGQTVNSLNGTTFAYATASTLYINQTANSANAGTISFYIVVEPLL